MPAAASYSGLYTGVDFADFLVGLPQQATAVRPGLERFIPTPAISSSDDWRVRSNLTVNAGLRYEYYSPYAEADNRLLTLDVAPGFVAVAPTLAGTVGPYSGPLPDTIVRPDRTAFAPRIGIAWKPQTATVVRAGYGVNYNSSVYQRIALQLAGQPPFATTTTVLASALTPVSLAEALATSAPSDTAASRVMATLESTRASSSIAMPRVK
jgi:hypothetical protein